MVKVSVIVPIYGVEAYIARCARSLFKQTLDDLEFIFVNDCTKDSSIEILKDVLEEYPQRKEQVRIVDMPINSGLAVVRQHGIQLATGEYLIHCDSDDWVDEDMYKSLYERAKEFNLDIVWCDYYKTNGVDFSHVLQSTQPILMQGPVWNKLVRASLYKNDIIYPRSNKAEDGALMTQISYYAHKRGYLNKPLYYYYMNPESICGQISEVACVNKLNQEIDNTELRIKFLREKGVINEYKLNVMIWKYETRKNLYPLMSQKKYRQLWRTTYPEVNRQYLLCKNISIKEKIKFLAIYMGIYRKLK